MVKCTSCFHRHEIRDVATGPVIHVPTVLYQYNYDIARARFLADEGTVGKRGLGAGRKQDFNPFLTFLIFVVSLSKEIVLLLLLYHSGDALSVHMQTHTYCHKLFLRGGLDQVACLHNFLLRSHPLALA